MSFMICMVYRDMIHFQQMDNIWRKANTFDNFVLTVSFQLQGGNKGQTHFFSIPQAHVSSDSERQSRCKCRAEVHFTFWLITYAGVCVSSVDQVFCYTCFSSTFAQFMLSIHLNFASACSAVLPYWGSSRILKSQFKLFNRSVMWCVCVCGLKTGFTLTFMTVVKLMSQQVSGILIRNCNTTRFPLNCPNDSLTTLMQAVCWRKRSRLKFFSIEL